MQTCLNRIFRVLSGTPLGYNLAVNTAMHAAVTANRAMQPSPRVVGSATGLNQGNSQPGFPPRPPSEIVHNSSPSFKTASEAGHPGQTSRTDYSPDTTTKDFNPTDSTASFLAYKAGEVLTTNDPNLVRTASAAPNISQNQTWNTSPDNSVMLSGLQTPLKPIVGTVQEDATLRKLMKNVKPEAPGCDCFPDNTCAPDSGPYYTHLGVASSLVKLREIMEKRCNVSGKALRIEKAVYCAREGKSKLGCPIAKYIIRRTNSEEKFLVVAKDRIGHKCEHKWIVISIVAWDGIPRELADHAYDDLSGLLGQYGKSFQRQCESNSKKTCACQGKQLFFLSN